MQGVADPGADFVDLTILQLGLTDQRRETAEATRWLDEADRDLLALWWLEAAGQITRGELAVALELTPAYAAVRVQRMKAHLEIARAVVRAIWATPRCAILDAEIRTWDGQPSSLLRKRVARHLRECSDCSAHQRRLVPAESLLAGIALVTPPVLGGVYGANHVWLPSPHQGPTNAEANLRGSSRPTRRKSRRTRSRLLTSKPIIASVALATACAGGAIALTADPSPASTGAAEAAKTVVSVATATTPATLTIPTVAASPSASHSATTSGTPAATAPRTSSRPSAAVPTSPVYGQTVDTADAAPADRFAKPGPLPKRPGTVPITATGSYSQPFKGSLGGTYLMFWSGQYVTITGTGYFRVRYEIAWFNRVGPMVMPTWTGLRGKLFHVASGGGRRMDDHGAGQPASTTWMGNAKAGYITLPSGAQQMWNNEYFYLDGSVTLHENEGYADYNLSVTPVAWTDVTNDIDTAPDGGGVIRYGLVRDTGTDAAPVPQYLTRSTPAKATDVPQHSEVEPSAD